MITGKTFTVQYDPREDRIRLILNYADPTQRRDLLITRAMLLKLIPVLEQILPQGAKAIVPQPNNTETPSKGIEPTDAATLQLTQMPQSYLLAKIDFKTHKEQPHITLLFYATSLKDPDASTTLAKEGLQQIVGLILGAMPFEWSIAKNILEH